MQLDSGYPYYNVDRGAVDPDAIYALAWALTNTFSHKTASMSTMITSEVFVCLGKPTGRSLFPLQTPTVATVRVDSSKPALRSPLRCSFSVQCRHLMQT